MKKTKFHIKKMDCPSEEKLVRMALESNADILKLDFDLKGRNLSVIHNSEPDKILSSLEPLNFGAQLKESTEYEPDVEELEESIDPVKEGSVLKTLILINGLMFVFEIIFGLYAESMGLISDSLDMLADAGVYGISLYAVGKALSIKKRAAKVSGYLQMLLAVSVLIETVRRFYIGSDPEGLFMVGVATVALIANVACLFVLFKHKGGEMHMKASWIFSTNDVIANVGVIIAGLLVYFFNSSYPDLVIGTVVGIVVLRGAFSILKISR